MGTVYVASVDYTHPLINSDVLRTLGLKCGSRGFGFPLEKPFDGGEIGDTRREFYFSTVRKAAIFMEKVLDRRGVISVTLRKQSSDR